MSADPLADTAAHLRSRLLAYLGSDLSRQHYAYVLRRGQTFTMPAAWGALPPEQRIEKVLAAETRRVAGGRTFALDAPVLKVARTVAERREQELPFTEEVLPAPSGMLTAAEPLCDLGQASMAAVTWGPPMEGFGPGVHLTWWAIYHSQEPGDRSDGPELVPDLDLHLPYAPRVDSRLWQADVSSGLLYSHLPLRTVVAAWYALTTRGVEIAEHRPEPALGRALAVQKAKHRSVKVAATASAEAVRETLTARAEAYTAPLRQGGALGGFRNGAKTPATASHGVFDPELDYQLDVTGRRVAAWYRQAAEHWHRLELEIIQAYPGIFQQLEELRVREFGRWPSWCWLPTAAVAAWLVHFYKIPAQQAMWDGTRIAAVGAWRSRGRHSLFPADDQPAPGAWAPVPRELPERMPAPGVGLIIPGHDSPRLVIAFADHRENQETGPELVLISNEGVSGCSFRDLTKFTLLLTGETLTDAVRATHQYYDQVAIALGEDPAPDDEALYAEHAEELSRLVRPLTAACAPDAPVAEAGVLVGRKVEAPWPPEPGLLDEMQLWLLGNRGTA
ncbi:hypothetical protein QQY66_34390 [Streptomyces sp. DG2A-72]|uniref:hypothetical protein n=1 Tax=Streptomyces sp. DG2A-72 TaxID=3051386 RepID=UPI00265BEF93|nr:hypothetical protein [Streptomyces sp. DG2A-72]MDO0936551.1 hypothetical protein [Streptomyces sp. DG2A-72]